MAHDKSTISDSDIQHDGGTNERTHLILEESSSTSLTRAHQHPNRTFCQLLRHGSQQFALEFAFSCETALGTPIVLELDIPVGLQGICWVLGPILGLALGPVFGSLSDNCTSSWGRRRPFLLVFNILTIVGCACYLSVQYIYNDGLGLTVAMIGILLVDLCAFLTESTSRAYLLDVCDVDDISRSLLMRSVMGGIGCGMGYAIVGIDWVDTSFGAVFNSNNDVVFLFIVIVYVVCMSLSMTSIAEEPLVDNRKNETVDEIRKKTTKKHYGTAEIGGDADYHPVEEVTPTLRQRFTSIYRMPSCLRWLAVTHFFGWASFATIVLYFTDYFAQEILHGVPTAPLNSTAYAVYQEGTRLGSWGLCMFGFSTAILSLLVFKIRKCISMKALYIGPPLIFSICLGSMAFLVDYPGVTLGLCSSFSLIFITILTVPYDLLALYHSDEKFTHPENGPVRGQGTDMGILFAMTFLGQIVSSLLIGPLITATESQLVVVIMTAFFAFMSVICAFFVTY